MDILEVTIPLDGRETHLLRESARRELRRPREQARYLLRQALLAEVGEVEGNANRDDQSSEGQGVAVAA